MAESWIQVALDGTGKRVRNLLLAAFTSGQDVYQQVVSVAKSDGTLLDDLSRSSVTQPVSSASLPLPAGASTEATLALIKAKTDNLDVALSTRTKPADSQHTTVDNASLAVTGTFFQATQPVSAASLPLPTGAALDATLTGGTTKAINRGGAKGATVAADITSNPIDANTQALHVDGSKVTQPVSGTFFQATQPVSSAAASQADGHSASIGTTTDLATANTVIGRLKQLVTLIAGGLPAALAASGGLKVDLTGTGANATAVKVDGSAVTQPVSGTVTTTPPANASTNVAQVAGSAAVNPSAQAGAWFTQPRLLVTYTAVYRLAARPYALSNAFAAAGRKQFATIHHTAAATKTVKIKRVEVAIESDSAASIIVADLVRITTAPATGNPAITPSAQNPGDAAAEAVCLALPTTAATEAGLQSMQEWDLGITGAGSTVMPPPGLNWYTLWPQTQGAPEAAEDKWPTMRAATLEGYAVTIDDNAITTVKGFVVIEFTEE